MSETVTRESWRSEAMRVAASWRDTLDLAALSEEHLSGLNGVVDLVAVGKAAPEMCEAASTVLGRRVRRRYVACDGPWTPSALDVAVVGEHPVPGGGSVRAGRRLLEFLDEGAGAHHTVFLVSGGASSICVAPCPPVTRGDLDVVWGHALASGWDIGRLNHVRAATSLLGGGAVLRRVRSARSRSLIMVDNVHDGARWVASGLTFDFRPGERDRAAILEDLAGVPEPVRGRVARSMARRDEIMAVTRVPVHRNLTLVEPGAALAAVLAAAARCGWTTTSMGATSGGIDEVIARVGAHVRRASDEVTCLAGVGEVTIRVAGDGHGGRCQEFALRMAGVLADLGRPGICVALATDGRDFRPGVGGAWSDETTLRRLVDAGVDPAGALARHDAGGALASVGGLIEGARTGWNLCDLYVVVLGPTATTF
jgi:glycerate 2-kinase